MSFKRKPENASIKISASDSYMFINWEMLPQVFFSIRQRHPPQSWQFQQVRNRERLIWDIAIQIRRGGFRVGNEISERWYCRAVPADHPFHTVHAFSKLFASDSLDAAQPDIQTAPNELYLVWWYSQLLTHLLWTHKVNVHRLRNSKQLPKITWFKFQVMLA